MREAISSAAATAAAACSFRERESQRVSESRSFRLPSLDETTQTRKEERKAAGDRGEQVRDGGKRNQEERYFHFPDVLLLLLSLLPSSLAARASQAPGIPRCALSHRDTPAADARVSSCPTEYLSVCVRSILLARSTEVTSTDPIPLPPFT